MSGPTLEIKVDSKTLTTGVKAIESMEKVMKRIIPLSDQMGLSSKQALKTYRSQHLELAGVNAQLAQMNKSLMTVGTTALVVEKNVGGTDEVFESMAKALDDINAKMDQFARKTDDNERKTKRWERTLKRIGRAMGSFGGGVSRLAGGASGLSSRAIGSIGSRGGQAFGGLLGGGGIGGLLGGAVRAPFAVAEFGLRIGGDLGESLISGVSKTLAGAGGAVSNLAGGLGAVAGVPLSIAGGALGLAGPIVGALGQASGAVLGAAGELGGQIAEKLVGALSVGLGAATIATGFSLKNATTAERLSPAFQSLTGSADQEATLNRLSDAVDGTVSKVELLGIANRALSLGAVNTVDELVSLAKAARELGNTMGRSTKDAIEDLSLGLARGSRLILDNVGLIINAKEAHEEYAQAIGTTASKLDEAEKREAVRLFGLKQADEKVKAATASTKNLTDSSEKLYVIYEQLKASISDIALEYGTALLPVAKEIGGQLKEVFDQTEAWMQLNGEALGKRVLDFYRAIPDYLEKAIEKAQAFGNAIKSALGISDDTTSAVSGFLGGTAPGTKALTAVGNDFGPVFNKVKDGFVSVITSEPVKNAAKTVGGWIAEGIWGAAKSGASSAFRFSAEIGHAVTNPMKLRQLIARSGGGDGGFGGGADPFLTSRPGGPGGGVYPAPINFGTGFLGSTFRGAQAIYSNVGTNAAQAIAQERLSGRGLSPDIVAKVMAEISGASGGSVSPSGTANRAITAVLGRERKAREKSLDALEDETKMRTRSLREFERTQNSQIRLTERFINAKLREVASLEDDRLDVTQGRIESLREIEGNRRSATRALPGQTLAGFESDINTPGLSLRARNQLLFRQRKEEQERVARINRTFGSRGFSDAFGSTPGLGGFGAGAGGGSGPLGGISGSVSAAEAQQELYRQIQASASFREEIAAINAAAAKETAVVEAESLALSKQLSEQIAAANKAAQDARVEQNKLNADLAKKIAEEGAAILANTKQIQKIGQQVRSLK